MRRLLLIALFAFGCTQSVTIPENPPRPEPFPGTDRPRNTPRPPASCREIGRVPCDRDNCGPGMDYVTLQCPQGVDRRCEANGGCRP